MRQLSIGHVLKLEKVLSGSSRSPLTQQQQTLDAVNEATDDAEAIRRICIGMVVLAGGLIAAMLVTSYAKPSAAGWVAVAGASIVFGSTGVPMKAQALKTLAVDPLVFALYNSAGIFTATLPLVVYLAATRQFVFKPWAILGATDICIIGYLAFMAVQRLGYCKAPAIWAGVGMIVSFVWGALEFAEPIRNVGMAAAAIVLLVVGVYSVSTSQDGRHEAQGDGPLTPPAVAEDVATDDTGEPAAVSPYEEVNVDDVHVGGSKADTPWQYSMGYALSLTVGFFDGSLLVPFKLTEGGRESTLLECLQYLASFGISTLFVAPTLFALYCVCVRRPRGTVPPLHLQAAFLPGASSGALWGAANFLSVHATFFLGIKVGFPLTQTCIIFAAAWGVLYFKEFALTLRGYLARFTMGISSIVVGAYLLGASG